MKVRILSGPCDKLPEYFDPSSSLTETFPVATGTVLDVTLSCTDNKLAVGDKTITCYGGSHFYYSKTPACLIQGRAIMTVDKRFLNLLTSLLRPVYHVDERPSYVTTALLVAPAQSNKEFEFVQEYPRTGGYIWKRGKESGELFLERQKRSYRLYIHWYNIPESCPEYSEGTIVQRLIPL